jgi:hypothetical protein
MFSEANHYFFFHFSRQTNGANSPSDRGKQTISLVERATQEKCSGKKSGYDFFYSFLIKIILSSYKKLMALGHEFQSQNFPFVGILLFFKKKSSRNFLCWEDFPIVSKRAHILSQIMG